MGVISIRVSHIACDTRPYLRMYLKRQRYLLTCLENLGLVVDNHVNALASPSTKRLQYFKFDYSHLFFHQYVMTPCCFNQWLILTRGNSKHEIVLASKEERTRSCKPYIGECLSRMHYRNVSQSKSLRGKCTKSP